MESNLFFTLSTSGNKQIVLNKKNIVSAVETNIIGQVEIRTIVGDTFLVSMPFASIWSEICLIPHRND